ncbi:MAG: S41 family peptidase [Candidatus Peregrinibacteria bacterium]|nr:S41 family peptidase [Candidatus Peregrinibacteria bacterium]MDZ4245153.1 S41 family peptidase [Candidatus Gracilibacteria bacterium]
MNSRRFKKYAWLMLMFTAGYLVALHFHPGSIVQTRIIDSNSSEAGSHTGLARSVDMELFWDVWGVIDQDYVYKEESDDKEDMVNGAIKGMLESLDDPYTLFMDPEETAAFDQTLSGELEGIGAEVTKKNGFITIVAPLKNSPADKAKLMPGDIIVEIDGESTELMTLGEAVKLIRGERGTKVKLGISRRGLTELLEAELVRDTVHFDSVTWGMKAGQIAYMEVVQFDDNTLRNFNTAINELILENPKGLIIDLRNNSGGYLDVAVNMLSELTGEKQKAVLIKGRNEINNKVIYTTGRARLDEIPLIVLINEGSASASEIVAGAVQDWERGTLIGKKSFGKGSVQELRPLEGGATLRITIAKWNTPHDHNINKEGIFPDVEVELTTEDHNKDIDPQLDCALEYFKKGSCSENL